jgi:type IV pilus assembly protein PilW
MTGNKPWHRTSGKILQPDAFTLVELLMVLALAGIATAVFYSVLPALNRVSMTQDEVGQMQQQLRAAMNVMVKEIRMAGYDPKHVCTDTISTADAETISFSLDSQSDGDCTDSPGDNIGYFLANCDSACTRDCKICLKRSTTSSTQNIAENIEALNFIYLDAGQSILNFDEGADREDIRFVQITLIARTNKVDPDYQDSNTYQNLQGAAILTTAGDGYRRRILSTTVRCRNMGLE